MDNSIVIWYLVVAAVLVASIIYFLKYILTHRSGVRHHHTHHFPVIGLSKESEMLYVPGDRDPMRREEDLNDW